MRLKTKGRNIQFRLSREDEDAFDALKASKPDSQLARELVHQGLIMNEALGLIKHAIENSKAVRDTIWLDEYFTLVDYIESLRSA